MNIDGELEDTDGVKESNTSFAKQQAEVMYNPEEVNKKQIISIIKKLEYDAVAVGK